MTVGELVRELRGGLADGVHQPEPKGGLEGCGDSAGGLGNRLVADAGDVRQILLERLDIGRHVHRRHYDIMMMSWQP